MGRLLLAVLLAATVATAQRGGGRNGRGGGADDGPMIQQRVRETRFERVSGRLKLNKQQKAGAETVLDEAQKEALPVAEAMGKARIAIAEGMINRKSDADVDALLAAYTQAAAQMAGIEAKAFSRIYAGLQPNQQAKAGPAFEEMAGIFLVRDWRRAR